ncbi:hypothetical protein ACIOVC_04355 [Pseudomonas neuropathica]|jgi:hypothetical protein|uniref:hypothetical protein n=1 Tax=Pseudomonas TaxID=286 RepID=UPI0008D3EBFC|nr:hypothetical protein [Pseudomonas sp. ok266]SEO98045.1 hypothetical protein SAMN04487856_112222 [Pseudomonas sp. ok266]
MELKFYQTAGGTYPQGQLFHAIVEVNSDQEDAERYQLYVCSVLDAIAQVPEDCDRLLAAISSVEAGVQPSITDGGNDVLLNMSDEGVQVDILVNDDWTGQPQSWFTLQEWRKVLEQWKWLLELPDGSDEVVILKLP